MGRPKKDKKDDKWKDLEPGFAENIAGATDEKVNEEIRKAALYATAMLEAKELDEDLAQKAAVAKDAGAVYRDVKKQCQLKIAFCRETLQSRGRAVPGDTRVVVKK